MSRNVLMIAFHFPPIGASSGRLRTLKFAKYLRDNDWNPIILSVHPRAYQQLDVSGVESIPSDLRIIRAFALDAKKHLSIRSRYPGWMAMPDRWVSWCLGAIPSGLYAIRKYQIDVIFSTYPIASAVLNALLLHRLSGVPWVADFRDPMTEEEYPTDPKIRRLHSWLEKQVVKRASRLIFTTQSTMLDQQSKYPAIVGEKSTVITNGFDEADFSRFSQPLPPAAHPIRIVHGGIIYPEDRDPRALFSALRKLLDVGIIHVGELSIELRGSQLDKSFHTLVSDMGLDNVIRFLPTLPYSESLNDAFSAHGLLVLQGASCDRQIPAKVYEYLRLGKPIIALTTKTGETGSLLRVTGGASIASIDDENEIAEVLSRFITDVKSGRHELPNKSTVAQYSRSHQAAQLADCLNGALLDVRST